MTNPITNLILLMVMSLGTVISATEHGSVIPGSNINTNLFQVAQTDTIPPSRALAPGTIKLAGLVIQMNPEKSGQGITFKFKVKNILGIGSSTPPVAKGDTLQIASVKNPHMLASGQYLECLIHHHKVLAGTQAPAWKLSKIISTKEH